jgi:hypothetical protein
VEVLAADRPVLGDDLIQGRAGDIAGDDEGTLALEVGVDHRRHPPVPDPAQDVDLAGQPGARRRVVGDVRTQQLEGHGAAMGVEGQVDHPHPAFAELLHKAVRADAAVAWHAEMAVALLDGLRGHAPTLSGLAVRIG